MYEERYRYFTETHRVDGINFQQYARSGVTPPLSLSELELWNMTDERRMSLGIHAGGDFSLVLFYKGIAAFMMSFKAQESDLWIVQLQGNKKKNRGYRVNTGIDVPAFFADQTQELLFHPNNTRYNRLILPSYLSIQGINIEDRRLGPQLKYEQLRAIMGMTFHPELDAFVLGVSAVQRS